MTFENKHIRKKLTPASDLCPKTGEEHGGIYSYSIPTLCRFSTTKTVPHD